ncbi:MULTISPECIES: response regulator [Planococcus]|uniref:Response regulator n=1 Tax=Planococcus faecalis TaxID=1598147 RepID=A0ABM6IW19_9BACL|nr:MULTISPECIES: response regulator [Planococcus]AQU80699.1 response regulator [Planococcus faecalis]MDJ0331903.1 response regulator [Planococcus sp. S3-L1]OHX55693.1 histidine kinase [Planococcus faecalis]
MKKILVADDEDILRILITDTLEDDFDVEEAEDGKEALQKIRDNDYDLIVLDYMMPYLTGLEVLEAVRNDHNTTKVLMLTAKAQDADRENAIAKGADYFMSKPFSPMELLTLVENILAS